MRYLVVDDDEASCRGVARRLCRFLPADDEVACAFSAEEALALMRDRPTDILVTDIRMGEMSGLQLIETVRRQKLCAASIILTAYDFFSYAQQAVRLEVKDFLLKPCSEAALRESVQRVTAGLLAQASERTGVTLEQLYQAICQGETLDSARLQALLGAHIPRTVRLVRLNGVRPGALCWPGRWSVADAQRRFMLVDNSFDSLKRWLADADRGDLCAGVSGEGDQLGELWRQAGEALHACISCGDVPAVLYQPELEHEGLSTGVLEGLYYVAAHLGEPIDMQRLCDQLHINYSYFSRLFKQQVGTTFSEYLLRRQMEWAKQALLSGKRVSEVARELGYLNAENFSRAFARSHGISPSRVQETAENRRNE